MPNKSQKIILGLIVFGALISSLVVTFFNSKPQVVSASVSQGSEYQSTTTPIVGFTNNSQIATTSYGTFGSVVITNVGTAAFTVYDGTTTDITKRTNNAATTTLASFGASTVAGTYTFDSIVTHGGIVISFGAGTQASTTITYR